MNKIKKDNDLIRFEENDYHQFDKPSNKDEKSAAGLVFAIVMLMVVVVQINFTPRNTTKTLSTIKKNLRSTIFQIW